MNKIKQAYDHIKLDEESKERIFRNIQNKKEKTKNNKKWIIKRLVPLVSVCACAMILFTNSTFQVKAGEYIKNVVNWIKGNTQDDYLKEVNLAVQNEGMQLRIYTIKRVRDEVTVNYQITFPFNIDDKINLDENQTESLFSSDIFKDCKIYINDTCIDKTFYANRYSNSRNIKGFDLEEINDLKIKNKNVLEQELIIHLKEPYLYSDFNFKFEYNKFKFDNIILEANLNAEYELNGKEYSGKIEIINIPEKKVSVKANIFNFYGYSYTKTGIKIYCKDEKDSYYEPNIILRATDNYGRIYLFYAKSEICNEKDEKILIYEINDMASKYSYEYSNCLNDNIRNLKVEIMTDMGERLNGNGYPFLKKVSEFEINFDESDN